MKQFLVLILIVFGLVALIPTESKAQVTISVGPGYSDRGYYQRRAYDGSSEGYYTISVNAIIIVSAPTATISVIIARTVGTIMIRSQR